MQKSVRIEIAFDWESGDWCAIVPTSHGTMMFHGKTPVLALQKALRKAGEETFRRFQEESEGEE